jgi:hypothetical protein
MIIIKLSDCSAEIIKQLEELDIAAIEKYGYTFSDERWSVDNILYQLPGKHQMSSVLINDDGNAVGYYVMSKKMKFINWLHRFVVKSDGNKFSSSILLSHMVTSFPKICGQVSIHNLAGIKLYERYGFKVTQNYSELYSQCPLSLEEFNTVIHANKAFLVRNA